jgi:glutamate N-acetyltransferase/amino-acid N-acetyltransferase
VARALDLKATEVFPSSTGIIGVPLPVDKITSHLRSLILKAGSSLEHLQKFSEAILTTDSKPKLASVPLRSGRGAITGVAKGAGMIHPQLATMLVYLMTDVAAKPAELKTALRKACGESFNAISIDGDTSTNDTVLLLASGASGIRYQSVRKEFDRALQEVCRSLAGQIVADGEGVEHVVRLRIEQARNRTEALQIARAVSHSLLVKTAWAGAEFSPRWDEAVCRSIQRKFPFRSANKPCAAAAPRACSMKKLRTRSCRRRNAKLGYAWEEGKLRCCF